MLNNDELQRAINDCVRNISDMAGGETACTAELGSLCELLQDLIKTQRLRVMYVGMVESAGEG